MLDGAAADRISVRDDGHALAPPVGTHGLPPMAERDRVDRLVRAALGEQVRRPGSVVETKRPQLEP